MVSDLLLYKAEFIKDIDNKLAQSIKILIIVTGFV